MAMAKHEHDIDRQVFFAEMKRRGWELDQNNIWIVPTNLRRGAQDADWYAALMLSITCKCPRENDKENTGAA
jgi:hypothetical protein